MTQPATPKKSPARKSPAKTSGTGKKTPTALSNDAETNETSGPATLEEDALPTQETLNRNLALVRAFMENPRQERIRDFLERLAAQPPQVLLLEGGTVNERTAAALFWALRLNCLAASPPTLGNTDNFSGSGNSDSLDSRDNLSASGPSDNSADFYTVPCCSCSNCLRFLGHTHRDFFFLDGLAGSIKIDDVRAIRGVIGESPREATYRVVIFREAQALVEAAANSLLKSFEEPRPGTSFLLLTPQRERLLPTLVSRSLTLTLPWPVSTLSEPETKRPHSTSMGLETGTAHSAPVMHTGTPHTRGAGTAYSHTTETPPAYNMEDSTGLDLIPWEASLCLFLETGRGWFDRTGMKGSVTAPLVHAILNMCRRALAQSILTTTPQNPLARLFSRLPTPRLRMVDEVLAECQDSLIYMVNPTLVLEWMATRLYLLLPR